MLSIVPTLAIRKKILGIDYFHRVCCSTVVSLGLLLAGCGCTLETHEDKSLPQWCKQVTPEYPVTARRAQAEGKVVLVATIDVDGRARDIEVTEDSVGFGCAQAAIKALKASRFIPAEQDGERISMRVSIPYVFRLED